MAWFKGINYIGRQRVEGVCVAISIINALKWAGNKKIKAKHIDLVYEEAGNPGEGTNSILVRRVLKNHCRRFLKVRYKKHASFKEIKDWLKQGNSIILDYFCNEENEAEIGHSVFIPAIDGDKLVIINDFDKSIYRMTLNRVNRSLLKTTTHYPGVYFIAKKEI